MAKKAQSKKVTKSTATKSKSKKVTKAKTAAKKTTAVKKSSAKPKKITAKKAPAKKASVKKAVTRKTVKKAIKKTVKAAPKKSVKKAAAARKPVKKTTALKVRKAVKKPVKRVATKRTVAVKKPAARAKTEGATFGVNTSTNNNAMEKVMTQGTKQFENITQEASEFGRDNVEAFIKSGTIFTKGFEDIFRASLSLAQSSAEKQSQFIKEAMTTKSLNEWADIQNKIAQANFDDFMEGATKISELSAKLLTEASEPINSQVTKGVNKATKAAA